MFDKEGLTPTAASAREKPDSEELLRTRIQFILRNAYTIPTTFMITTVIELIYLSMDEIKDIIKSEASEHGWETEFSDARLCEVRLYTKEENSD